MDFKGPNDAYYKSVFGGPIMQMIFEARREIYVADLIRAFVFVILSAGMLYGFLFNKCASKWLLLG